MGKQYTGIDGALFLDGQRVARVSSWSFSASAATLSTTSLGDFAETSIYGIQSFNGTCTIFYYEKDGGGIEGAGLMTDVIRTTATPTEPTHELELRYENGATLHAVKFKCLLNTVNIDAEAGGITEANVTFTVTGPLSTATLA
jgi:hypothetical protein